MSISTYRIEYDEDGLELKYLLKLDRSKLSDQDLIDILGNTCSSIEGAIAEADDDLELAVANASRETAIKVAFEFADAPGAKRHAADETKRYDGWAGDHTTFEFLKIQLDYNADLATVTKMEEEPTQ
jgi:hypothetical protein